jgi:hypothetical protein
MGRKRFERTYERRNKSYGVSIDKENKYIYYAKKAVHSTGTILNRINPKPPYYCKNENRLPGEASQIFEEAWRTIRDGFMIPNFTVMIGMPFMKNTRSFVFCIYEQRFPRYVQQYARRIECKSYGMYTRAGETQEDATGVLV